MAVPKRKIPRSQDPLAPRRRTGGSTRRPARCARTAARSKLPAHRVRQLRLVPRPPGPRRRVSEPRGRRACAITIAIDAMGGDRAPGEIVAGALAAVDAARRRRPARRASRTRSRAQLPGGDAADGVEIVAASEVDRDARRARRRRCARKKDSSIVRVRRGGARRPGRRDGRRRATPARRWPPRCCAWAGSRASPGPRSRCRSRCPGRPPAAPRRRRRDRRLHAGVARRSSRVHGPRVRRGSGSASTSRRVGLLSNGEEPGKGDDAAQGGVRRCSTAMPGFVGNVEGRDLMHAGRRRDRHRRLHRQRRAEDGRGRDPRASPGWCSTCSTSTPEARGGGRRVVMPRCSRPPRTLDPDNTGGVRAARRRRRVRDLARLVVGARDRRTRSRRARRVRRGRASSSGMKGGGRRCRLRPTSSAARSAPTTCSRMVREQLAEILEIDDDAITLDSRLRRRPRRRRLALIELVEALEEELGERTVGLRDRRRRPRRAAHGARRGRLRRCTGSSTGAAADEPRPRGAVDPAARRAARSSRSGGPSATTRCSTARSRTARGAPSTAIEESNERLEFLGDSVLGLVVTALRVRALPAAPRGPAGQAARRRS